MKSQVSESVKAGSQDTVARYALFYLLSPQHWIVLRPWIRKVASAVLLGTLIRRLLQVDATYPERFFWGLVGLIRCAAHAFTDVVLHRVILKSHVVEAWSVGRQMSMKTVGNVVQWMVKKMKQDRTHAKPIREALEVLAAPIVTVINAYKGFSRSSLVAAGVNCEIVCQTKHLSTIKRALHATQHCPEHDKIVWLVHIHGGGFVLVGMATGNVLSVGMVESIMAHDGYIPVVIAVDYSMSPEAIYPEALHEVHSVYMWLNRRPCNKNGKIILTGDSAGGNLALCTSLALNGDSNGKPFRIEHPRTRVVHEFELGPQPICMALFSPMLDTRTNRRFLNSDDLGWLSPAVVNTFALEYIGYHSNEAATQELASPLYASRLAEVAPVLVQYGDEELFYDDCNQFFDILEASKTRRGDKKEIYYGMGHAFHIGVLVGCGVARKALDNTALYIKETLDSRKSKHSYP